MKVKKDQKRRMGRGKLKEAGAALAGGNVEALAKALNENARNRQKWARERGEG